MGQKSVPVIDRRPETYRNAMFIVLLQHLTTQRFHLEQCEQRCEEEDNKHLRFPFEFRLRQRKEIKREIPQDTFVSEIRSRIGASAHARRRW